MSTAAGTIARPLSSVPLTVTLAVSCSFSVLLGAMVVTTPAMAVAAAAGVALVTAAFLHPPIAAYVLISTTPLIAGMDRGAVLPLLRPNEAVALLLGAALAARGVLRLVHQGCRLPRLRTTDGSLLLLVFTGSLLPLVWRAARGADMTSDDVFYGMALMKYFALYLLVRTSVRTEQHVRRCLWLSVAAGSIVAIVGILQALNLFGVPGLLAAHFAPYGDEGVLYLGRGSSTLSHAQAMGSVMAFNLAIVGGLLAKGSSKYTLLVLAGSLFLFGALASGQFSGAVALFVAIGAVGFVTRSLHRAVVLSLPSLSAAAVALRPVIERRLRGFSTPAGVPGSWVGRLENLRTYFWPELKTNFNYALGVRPAARVPSTYPGQYVFIESGHTWLFWTGGIPLFVAFFLFLWTNMGATARIARRRADAIGVAGVASFAALAVLAVLTVFDPHLTLRGAADLNFALLALAHTAYRHERPEERATPGDPISSKETGSFGRLQQHAAEISGLPRASHGRS